MPNKSTPGPDLSLQIPGYSDMLTHNRELFRAVVKGNAEDVRTALAAHADPNSRDKDGNTPLHYAVRLNKREVVELLVASKAEVNATNTLGGSPLHVAVEARIPLIETLIELGAAININAGSNISPLGLAVLRGYINAVQILLEHGAISDSLNLYGAITNQQFHAAIALIRHGENVNSLCGGLPLLHHAAALGAIESIDFLLLHKANINAEGVGEITALWCAVDSSKLEATRFLIEQGTDVNLSNPLATAQHKANWAFSQLLIKAGASIKAPGIELHTLLNKAIAAKDYEVAELLLQNGATEIINTVKFSGESFLHKAAAKGDFKACELLIKYGADVNAVTENNATPLHRAASAGSAEVVKLLLANGADPGVRTIAGQHFKVEGSLPLDYAAVQDNPEVFKLLFEATKAKGIEILDPEMEAKYAIEYGIVEVVQALLDTGLSTEKKNNFLFKAAQVGQAEVVKLLLVNGADSYIRDEYGQTPLQRAIRFGSIEVIKLLLNANSKQDLTDDFIMATRCNNTATMGLLLDRGADINSLHRDFLTPLHVAAEYGCVAALKWLLDKGASRAFLDEALRCAVANSKANAVKFLVQQGGDISKALGADIETTISKLIDGIKTSMSSAQAKDTLSTLIESGMEIPATQCDHHSPLFYAYHMQQMIKAIKDNNTITAESIGGRYRVMGSSLVLETENFLIGLFNDVKSSLYNPYTLSTLKYALSSKGGLTKEQAVKLIETFIENTDCKSDRDLSPEQVFTAIETITDITGHHFPKLDETHDQLASYVTLKEHINSAVLFTKRPWVFESYNKLMTLLKSLDREEILLDSASVHFLVASIEDKVLREEILVTFNELQKELDGPSAYKDFLRADNKDSEANTKLLNYTHPLHTEAGRELFDQVYLSDINEALLETLPLLGLQARIKAALANPYTPSVDHTDYRWGTYSYSYKTFLEKLQEGMPKEEAAPRNQPELLHLLEEGAIYPLAAAASAIMPNVGDEAGV
jgi:ankyrin repeat protein